MARPITIPDAQILDAARRVFLDRGYGASTADVAKAAGVSEGTLFKRFETKDALFFASLELPQHAPWMDSLQERVGNGDVRTHLLAVAEDLLGFFRDLLPRLTMTWSCRVTPAPSSHLQVRQGTHLAQEATQALVAYFEAEMAVGRLRKGDAQVVVRLFIGALYHFASMEMFGVRPAATLSPDAFLGGLVNTLWYGLCPTTGRRR